MKLIKLLKQRSKGYISHRLYTPKRKNAEGKTLKCNKEGSIVVTVSSGKRNDDRYGILKPQITNNNYYYYTITLSHSKALLKCFPIVIKEYNEKYSCIVKVCPGGSLSNLPNFRLTEGCRLWCSYISLQILYNFVIG
jgi:hypothetical protein